MKNLKTCIICRLPKENFNDEHVIPDSIKGYYHIYSVCVDCNSKMGALIDNKLTNHRFIEFQRYLLGIKGKSGTIPNPLTGTYITNDEDAHRVRLEENSEGNIKPKLLPIITKTTDGPLIKSFTIKIDVSDEKNMDEMLDKLLSRNGLSRNQVQTTVTRDESHPWLHAKIVIDTHDFKMALLKIAYEFAVDKVPSYFNDAQAKVISQILLQADYSNLTKKVTFLGSGFDDKVLKPFEHLIDFKNNNHYLILTSFEHGLMCSINLFNAFSIAILLSKTHHFVEDNVIVGKNDIEKCTFQTFNTTKLIDATFGPTHYQFGYRFKNQFEANDFLELQRQPDFELYQENGAVPFFDSLGEIKYENVDYKLVQPQLRRKVTGDTKKEFLYEFTLNELLFIKILPSNKLLRVISVKTERRFIQKI